MTIVYAVLIVLACGLIYYLIRGRKPDEAPRPQPVPTPRPDPAPLFIQTLEWKHIPAPSLAPTGSGWDGESVYAPAPARNLDRSLYRDAQGLAYLYYIGDNTPVVDLDQTGLATSRDLKTWTRHPGNPVIKLGQKGAPDHADAQITQVYHDGKRFIYTYLGNENREGTDFVRLMQAESKDGRNIIKLGIALEQGGAGWGDQEDLYSGKVVPAGHDGRPKLFYLGEGENGRGWMCATSMSGSLTGPWSKLMSTHFFSAGGSPWLGDVWWEGGMYHFLFNPQFNQKGCWYATCDQFFRAVDRGKLIEARANPHWDRDIRFPQYTWDETTGLHYVFFSTISTTGLGYVYSETDALPLLNGE